MSGRGGDRRSVTNAAINVNEMVEKERQDGHG